MTIEHDTWSAGVPAFPVTARRRAPGEPPRIRRLHPVGTVAERLARLDALLGLRGQGPVPDAAPRADADDSSAE